MMKTQLGSLWFALVLAACGTDDRTAPSRTEVAAPVAVATPEPVVVAPAPAPIAPPVDVAKPLPTKYGEALADGKAAAAKGDTAHARELLEAAAKLDRKQADPHIELARMFIATHDKALALTAAKKAVKLAPDSSRAWNTLGRAELARWSYQGASAAFEKAAKLDPDNAWAWNNLGFTELEFKSYGPARDALVIATSKPNATGFMFNNLGTAYEHLNLLDEARDAFEQGGKLGSKEALASRKRLEGVEPMIAVVHEPKAVETTYAHDEGDALPEPEAPAAVESSGTAVEPAVETSATTPTVEAPTDAGVMPATL